jgi:hypothetical protein
MSCLLYILFNVFTLHIWLIARSFCSVNPFIKLVKPDQKVIPVYHIESLSFFVVLEVLFVTMLVEEMR